MSAESPVLTTPERKSRRMLLLVAAVCIAPFIGSWALYFLWQPSGRINYGELVSGVTVPTGVLAPVSGSKPFDFAQVRGRWVFVTIDAAACAEACQTKLWKMRQVRLTQGKYLERIERVMLVSNGDAQGVAASVAKEYEGMWIASTQSGTGVALQKLFPFQALQSDHIYLVDPLGNVMLSFPKDADPSRMKKDLQRLLRVSRIG